MIHLKFYYCKGLPKKLPPRVVRKQRAFVHPLRQGIFAMLVLKEKEAQRSPDADLWGDLKPKEIKLGLEYPLIKQDEWFTYRKVDGEFKKQTLYQYIKNKEE